MGEHIVKRTSCALNETRQSQAVPAASHSNTEAVVARHLLSTGHLIGITRGFRPIFHSNRSDILRFIEAVTIKRMSPL